MQALADALALAGSVDEALRLLVECVQGARRTLPVTNAERRSGWNRLWAMATQTGDPDLAVVGLRCLLDDDLGGLGVTDGELIVRSELARQLRDQGAIDQAITELRAILALPRLDQPTTWGAQAELADLLARRGDPAALAEAAALRDAKVAAQAQALLGQWRDLSSTVTDPTSQLSTLDRHQPDDPAPVLVTDGTLPPAMGLDRVPPDRVRLLLRVAGQLRDDTVGRRLMFWLSQPQIAEFQPFLDRDEPSLRVWLDQVDPGWTTAAAYRAWTAQHPDSDPADLTWGYGARLWLDRTFPDYQRVVISEMDHLVRVLRLVADDILADGEAADATDQEPPLRDPD
jgi:hypothetical protein